VTCHGGVEAADKEEAHDGMIADPSADPVAGCGGKCHLEEAQKSIDSIHTTLAGERRMIELRAGHPMADDPALEQGFAASCEGCHTTCGQCHVSRPDSAGGGFVDGHTFNKTPSMINQCTACHGSRVGDDYRGVNPGVTPDVHYLAGKRCEFCHEAEEMHAGRGEHRYAVQEMPRCEDCHSGLGSANVFHIVHDGDLSCQVCHSQDYKQCASCHVSEGGITEPSWISFKIGRNPLPDEREYGIVTLRHVPVVRDTYAGWGYEGDLPYFDDEPNWKYTSPHNIQRFTPRTTVAKGEGCEIACHSTLTTPEGWFLRQSDLDLYPADPTANESLILDDASPWERP